jgi:hypothetical protein
MKKLDFNDFNRRGYAPSDVWKAYATLTCYHLGIRQGGSLGQLSQAWAELRNLNCHYVDRIKVIRAILELRWQRADTAVAENAFLTYKAWAPGRPENVSLETKGGVFGIPFKKWSHGLKGSDLSEDTSFEVIVIDPEALIPLLREHGVYSGKSFAGNDWLYLEIIDD